MSEKQNEYSTLKTGAITYTELLKYISGFAEQKMYQNTHKPDPLSERINERTHQIWDEVEESDEALDNWIKAPSEENAMKYLNECGDVINEIIFTAAKVAGYTSLIRK